MVPLFRRWWMALAIFALFACLSYAQNSSEPLSDREVIALVAGNSLSENIVHEIQVRGLAFRPSDQFRALVTDAGGDSRVLAALDAAKVSEHPATTESNDTAQLLQHLSAAGKFLRNKRYDEATRELTAALQNGGGAETGFVMGEVLRQQEEWVGAASIYGELQRQAPDFPELHTKLSFILHKLNEGDEALNEAKIALAENPNNPEAHKNAGLALLVLKKFNASEQEFHEALRLKPDYENARLDLGLVFSDEGRDDSAIVEFKKAIALDASDWLPHYDLGTTYQHKGDLDSAIRELREAIRLNPAEYAPRQNLGSALVSHGMYADAVRVFREMEAKWPNSSICHACLGNALYMTWDFDGAEKEFRKAIALDPTDAFAHRGLGRIRQQQKEYDAALSEFREAEKLDETSPESYRGAGSVLIAMQDYSRAAKELKQAENLNPGDPVVHDLYGQALSGMGDNKGAVVEFKQALALNPKQPQVMLELASSLEKTGDWVASLGEYHQAALADHEPGTGTQDRYKTAQERFKQHIAALRASGKSAEATALEDSLRASNANPGLSQRLDEALLKAEGEVKDQRFDEAGRDYKDAVELAGKVQPVDDRLVTALLGVSNFYGRENDFVHVEASLQRALEVTQELHGAESPEMTRPLQILGSYFLYRHDADTAFKYFSRAVEVNEKIFGEGSDKVALSLVYLSTVFTVQQDYAKAEPYLLRAAQIEETYYAAGGVGMDMVLASLCDLYTKWNKPEKADPRYRQTIALLEKEFGPDSPVLLSTLSEEAETLRKLGRTDEAEKFERRAQVIREATGQTDSQPFPEPPK